MARLFELHGGRYGSPRITADLKAAGWRVSEIGEGTGVGGYLIVSADNLEKP